MPPRLAALAAITLWGVSFVATKAALREVSPVTLIFGRFALGALLLCGLVALRGEPVLPPRGSRKSLALLAFVGVFVHHMVQVHGLALTSAVSTGWLIGLVPIWSALLATMFLGERFDRVRIAGLLLGFAGAALVVTRGRFDAGLLALPSTRGDLLVLASTVNWAVYTVLARAGLAGIGARRATAGVMLYGWAMLAPPFVILGGWREFPALSWLGWACLLFLGLGCSGLGYLLWYGALAQLDAARVSAFLYLEPLVTLAAAALLLGEPVGATTVTGGLIVLAGVFLVQRGAPSGR